MDCWPEEIVGEEGGVHTARYSWTYDGAGRCGGFAYLDTRGRTSEERLEWRVGWGWRSVAGEVLPAFVSLLTQVGPQVVQAGFAISLFGEDGRKVGEDMECPIRKFTTNQPFTFPDSVVTSPVKSVTITFRIVVTDATAMAKRIDAPNQTSGDDAHSRFRRGLFLSDKHSDMKMTVGGKEFPVHGLVLSAVSPVFEAMLRSEMAEKTNGVIEVTDTTPDVMESVLRYIYTGEVVNLKKSAVDIVKVAEKYQILDLKDLCQNELADSIVRDNALELYCAAQTYRLDQLRAATIQYIRDNKILTEGNADWEESKTQNPKMALQLMEDILKSIKN